MIIEVKALEPVVTLLIMGPIIETASILATIIDKEFAETATSFLKFLDNFWPL